MKLLYFAWLRERLDINEEVLELPTEVTTIAELLEWLRTRNELFEHVFEDTDIIQVALDKRHVQDRSASLDGISEIALFPPMTGG